MIAGLPPIRDPLHEPPAHCPRKIRQVIRHLVAEHEPEGHRPSLAFSSSRVIPGRRAARRPFASPTSPPPGRPWLDRTEGPMGPYYAGYRGPPEAPLGVCLGGAGGRNSWSSFVHCWLLSTCLSFV